MIDNKITIKDDEKVNIQRGAIGHRSTWTGLTYKYAAEAGKAEEAEKIIRHRHHEQRLDAGLDKELKVSKTVEEVRCQLPLRSTGNLLRV